MKVKPESSEAHHVKIGELSRRTGVSPRSLRYYEEQDLLHPQRAANGYRTYPEGSAERVEQIRDLLKAGLSTQVIRELVPCFIGSGAALRPMHDATLAANLARELADIQHRIDTLVRHRDAIRAFAEAATDGGTLPAAPAELLPCAGGGASRPARGDRA